MKMLYGCPFEKIHFLPKIDTNSGFWRDWGTLSKKFNDGTFIALQMKIFKPKNFKIHVLCQKCQINQLFWDVSNRNCKPVKNEVGKQLFPSAKTVNPENMNLILRLLSSEFQWSRTNIQGEIHKKSKITKVFKKVGSPFLKN